MVTRSFNGRDISHTIIIVIPRHWVLPSHLTGCPGSISGAAELKSHDSSFTPPRRNRGVSDTDEVE
jgi:hypothetical protein